MTDFIFCDFTFETESLDLAKEKFVSVLQKCEMTVGQTLVAGGYEKGRSRSRVRGPVLSQSAKPSSAVQQVSRIAQRLFPEPERYLHFHRDRDSERVNQIMLIGPPPEILLLDPEVVWTHIFWEATPSVQKEWRELFETDCSADHKDWFEMLAND